jgi:hypothetical protein
LEVIVKNQISKKKEEEEHLVHKFVNLLLINKSYKIEKNVKMMAVAAAQKNREMFAIKKSYSIEVSISFDKSE